MAQTRPGVNFSYSPERRWPPLASARIRGRLAGSTPMLAGTPRDLGLAKVGQFGYSQLNESDNRFRRLSTYFPSAGVEVAGPIPTISSTHGSSLAPS